MLPPNNTPLSQLAKEDGVSAATLAKWRADARAKGRRSIQPILADV
ncbi:MAG: hypothetical protein KGS44_12220 [Alphaproteobacteria bacterium]|nr:hypothetical protein [Alphaproteobacteria bacterium]